MNRGPQVVGIALAVLLCVPRVFASGPLPVSSRAALSADGYHIIEGLEVAPAWSWHVRLVADGQVGKGPMDDATLVRARVSAGLAFPGRIEVDLALPVGALVVAASPLGGPPEKATGVGLGDLELALMWTAIGKERALGLLVGAIVTAPTGDESRMLGEQGFAVEPLLSLATNVLGTRLCLNLAYRFRAEPSYFQGFEQDDDVIWRIALRVPKENDVAFTLMSEGAVGVATGEGPWPSRRARPVLVGGGIDLPASRHGRFATYLEIGIDGATAPSVLFGLQFTMGPVRPDEDRDGVGSLADDCPLLVEDMDGFQDRDGCPDLDNDKDGFPDDEDRCPDAPATSDFSADGC